MIVSRKHVFEHLEEQLEMYYQCTGINVLQLAANGETTIVMMLAGLITGAMSL